jgi:hypothetical protein
VYYFSVNGERIMKGRIQIATILAILVLTISSLPLVLKVGKGMEIMSMSDAELSTQFNEGWGPSYAPTITDVSGNGVQFDYPALSATDGTAVKDGYPVSALAGGALNGEGHTDDFSANAHYSLTFRNIGAIGVSISLFMNTGYTDPKPPKTGAEDTWWETPDWTWVDAGETKVISLNFSAAKCWNAADDPVVEWRAANGAIVPVRRLNETTSIGFQVCGDGSGSIIVSSLARLYTDPDLVEKHAADIDSFFNVTFRIEDFNDLAGFDLNITWNNALIAFEAESYSAYLSALWSSYNVVKHENGTTPDGTGYYKFVALSLAGGHSSVASMVLLKLTFKVRNPLTNSMRETVVHFETHKLSDSNSGEIEHVAEDGAYRIWGQKPTLIMNPTTKTCRTYGETLSVSINVSDAAGARDFEFEIRYNTTLLDYVSVTYDAWGTGSISTDDISGRINGSTSGGSVNGNEKLITITFSATFYRIWKNLPGWQNDQSGMIYIQAANLSYPYPEPKLGYVRGGSPQEITVGSDVTYTFSPIKGDVDNDGDVDITDLGDVAYYYDQIWPTYNLIGEPVVDIFDLVLIASNYGFVYTP